MSYFPFKGFLLATLFSYQVVGQTSFDQGLKSMAQDISSQIENTDIKKIGVLGFFTETGEETNLGKLITEDFSVYLTNPSLGYQIYDRVHLNLIIEENKLGSQRALVNPKTILRLGEIEGLQGIVTGTYSIVGENLRVRVKLINASTALQIGAAINNLKLDSDLKQYLGISFGSTENATNRGFSSPLNSNESYNNPLTVSNDCKDLSSGDMCFFNTTKEVLQIAFFENFSPMGDGRYSRPVTVDGVNKRVKYRRFQLTLQSGETQCIYNVGTGSGKYAVWKHVENILYPRLDSDFAKAIRQGHVNIELCKSKTFTIR